MAGITPTGAEQIGYNFYAMILCLGLASISMTAKIYNLISPNLISEYLNSVIFPLIVGISALNLIYTSLQDWRWIAPLALMYPVAMALPFLNQKLSVRLAHEINAPSSFLGKIILFEVLAIAPLVGLVGVWLTEIRAGTRSGVMGASFLGLFLHFIFVWSTVNLAQQAWEKLPESLKYGD